MALPVGPINRQCHSCQDPLKRCLSRACHLFFLILEKLFTGVAHFGGKRRIDK